MGLVEKLMIIQLELIAPKNQWNDFGNFKYRSCEDILEGLKPCLAKVKAAVTISDEIVLIGERYYVRATATLHDAESDAKISNSAYAREDFTKKGMDSAQITGTTSSYARKYALNGLFSIDDVKDADYRLRMDEGKKDEGKKDGGRHNQQPTKQPEQKQPEQKRNPQTKHRINDTKAQMLVDLCMKDGVDIRAVLAMYKVQNITDLTEIKFRNINEHWDDIKSAIFSR